MLISILVNSYNYEQFVGATIRSALAQTYPNVEVIVVDDGSSDGSWKVIESFGDRITAIKQNNGGQGSAYNAAFERARGEFVLFLDSDDTLDPDAIARCVADIDAETSKVQFRLRLVDRDDKPVGGSVPYLMHSGNVLPTIERFLLYAGPPGSGNLYRRSSIADYFPLDSDTCRRGGADTVPFVLSAFSGRIVSINEALGNYRLHTQGLAANGIFGNVAHSFREILLRERTVYDVVTHLVTQEFGADRLALVPLPIPSNLRLRLLSWKLDRANHVYRDDTAWNLAVLSSRVFAQWPGYRPGERLTSMLWAFSILFMPRRLAQSLAWINSSGRSKGFLRHCFGARNNL